MVFKLNLNEGSVAEFKGQIVYILEDYLYELAVELDVEERSEVIEAGEIDWYEVAIIFGELYDVIADTVGCMLDEYNLLKSGRFSHLHDVINAVCEIASSYMHALEMGMIKDRDLCRIDWNYLRTRILETFDRWGLLGFVNV